MINLHSVTWNTNMCRTTRINEPIKFLRKRKLFWYKKRENPEAQLQDFSMKKNNDRNYIGPSSSPLKLLFTSFFRFG